MPTAVERGTAAEAVRLKSAKSLRDGNHRAKGLARKTNVKSFSVEACHSLAESTAIPESKAMRVGNADASMDALDFCPESGDSTGDAGTPGERAREEACVGAKHVTARACL